MSPYLVNLDVAGQDDGSVDPNADVGSYSYSARPHAVTDAGGTTYTYNANGSMISGDGRSITYGVFNKPTSITRGSRSVHLYYGPGRDRYRRVDDLGQSSETETHYVGSVERIWKPGNVVVTKRYLGGEAILTETDSNGSTQAELHYLLKDHLGSTDLIVDSAGNIAQAQSFDAFGLRRRGPNFIAFSLTSRLNFDTSYTTQGFTGHEGLDPVGLIHMNGRVYDPKLGRFASADPFIQATSNTQSFNRYSYGWNNPLSTTDPSGHFVFSLLAGLAIAAGGADLAVTTIALIAGVAGVFDAITQGLSFQDALIQGIVAGATGAAFSRLGAWAEAGTHGLKNLGNRILAFGTVGGIGSSLRGGKFGNGFLSAGLAGPLSDSLTEVFGGGRTASFLARTVAGGSISRATGGKFANGAAYAAFSMAVIAGAHAAQQSAGNQGISSQAANKRARGQRHHFGLGEALSVVGSIAGKVWNLPNTIVGLTLGGFGHVAGWIMGTNPYITFGNNAIQFHNNPLMGSAMTLGNTIVYGPRYAPSNPNAHFRNTPSGHTVGREERRHTVQGQILGPLYFPAHALGGITSMLRGPHPGLLHPVDAWHQNNFMETGPMQDRTF